MMGKFQYLVHLIWILGVITSCTSNPIGDDEIGTSNRQIQGQIGLSSQQTPDNVIVWLESFNIVTKTDGEGKFGLTLPASAQSSGVSGFFRVYYFLANFNVDSSSVLGKDGEFVYSSADINNEGELKTLKILRQFLRIETQVSPSVVLENSFTGSIEIAAIFSAVLEPVTVIIPKTIGGVLGAALIKNIDTGSARIVLSNPGIETDETVRVGQTPVVRKMSFNFSINRLSKGKYEIVPYFLIKHQEIPAELWLSIGEDLEQLGQNYLKIPIKSDNEILTVN